MFSRLFSVCEFNSLKILAQKKNNKISNLFHTFKTGFNSGHLAHSARRTVAKMLNSRKRTERNGTKRKTKIMSDYGVFLENFQTDLL